MFIFCLLLHCHHLFTMRGYSLNYRDVALYQAFLKAYEECSPEENLYLRAINSPAPSFFASERLAHRYVVCKEQGLPIPRMLKLNRAKYEEIYSRYQKRRRIYPHLTISDILKKIIHSQAPRFYIEEQCAKLIIKKVHERSRRK